MGKSKFKFISEEKGRKNDKKKNCDVSRLRMPKLGADSTLRLAALPVTDWVSEHITHTVL